MQVFPDSVLRIHKGCPCDPDYEHTINIGNKEGQHAYFTTITKYRINNLSYQRANKGSIRVNYNVNDLYDCNYISFQNSSFGNKWFYAFIDNVEYVNNTTSEIFYSLDVLQTWMYDVDLTDCFVAREHSVTDVAGDNLVPENIDTGVMQMKTAYQSVGEMDTRIPMIVVAQTASSAGVPNEGAFYGNTYSQAIYQVYEPNETGIAELSDYLNTVGLLDNPNVIVSIFMCPNQFLKTKRVSTNYGGTPLEYNVNGRGMLYRSNGEAIRNNKMLTFPYTYLQLTNLSGETRNYAYEYFNEADAGTLRFQYNSSYTDTMSFTLTPRGYKVGLTGLNFDESITYKAFPVCTYAVSDFASRILSGGISAALSALAGGLTGGIGGAVLGGVTGALSGFKSNSVQNTGTQRQEPVGRQAEKVKWESVGAQANQELISNAEIVAQCLTPKGANLIGGSCSSAASDLFNGNTFGIYYTQMQPTQEYIDRIDDYFSRYGYATNKIKTPNIDSRPHWNYVQTVGCKVNGSIPCNDERAICAIFDKGVTFWKNPSEVGNFSLDNSPT